MKIKDLYKPQKTVVSFEVFPPKRDGDIATVYQTIDALKCLRPDFISVTFGAGGAERGSAVTSEIVQQIHSDYGLEALAHLTCAGVQGSIEDTVLEFKKKGIENILALRGDDAARGQGFRFAKDLIAALKGHGFCMGAAAYPEGHITCESLEDDIRFLKQKQDAGADFFVTQLFFDNALFYRFLEKARNAGITKPISAGIMPIVSKSQIQRMIFMCGVSLPAPIVKMIGKYGDEGESLVQAGVEFSLRQMQDLCDNRVEGVHIYTMNKPFIAEYCVTNLRVERV